MALTGRWRKLIADVRQNGDRIVAVLAALSVGVFTVATMLGAYGIVGREIGVNYLATNPASATIEVDEVTPLALATAKSFPGIAAAEARGVVEARAMVGEEWMRLLLFVVDDFDDLRLNTFTRDSGAWPPPAGSLLIERQAVGFLDVRLGGSLTVKPPHGAPRAMPVTGIVHDTTLAPSWQEQTGYGYVTLDTLAALGERPVLDELRIQLDGNPFDTSLIDAKAVELAETLRAQGVEVRSVKVPPPGEHPHQGQMLTSLRMFLAFASLALVLAAILVAAVLNAILARQVREIAIMKAIGARSSQLAAMYCLLLVALGAAALAVALPLGIAAAGRLSQLMADTMNFTVTSAAVPAWVYAVLVAAGLFLPLLVSAPTISAASRRTVREALGGFGGGATFGARRFDRALALLGGFALPYLLAVRNMFRRRGRLAVALAMLAVGGGLFMTSLNIRDGWREMAGNVMTTRFYDGEFLLSEPAATGRIGSALASVPNIGGVEIWQYTQTAFAGGNSIDVMRTYPDRGHGSFALYGVPRRTTMVKFPIVEGRWLEDGDVDAIVLTPRTMRQDPNARVGGRIRLSVGGRPSEWRIVGVALEVGGTGGYVSSAGYAKASQSAGTGSDIRVAAQSGATAEERDRVVRAAEAALDDAGFVVQRSMPLDRLYDAMAGHVAVPIGMMMAASLLLALIGGIGLASMMAVNVLDRTREVGVIRAIGAAPATVMKIVIGEAVATALISWLLALLLSLPLSRAIGLLAGGMFGAPLPFTVSTAAAAMWLALVLIIAVAASSAPALRASRLIVREALAYE